MSKVAEVEVSHSFWAPEGTFVDGVVRAERSVVSPGIHTLLLSVAEDLQKNGTVVVRKVDGEIYVNQPCCG